MDGDDYDYEPEDLEQDGSRYEMGAQHYKHTYNVKYYPHEDIRWEGFPWNPPTGQSMTADFMFDQLVEDHDPTGINIVGKDDQTAYTDPNWNPVNYPMTTTNLFKCDVSVSTDYVAEQQIYDDPIDEYTEITLDPNTNEYWITYWVQTPQRVDEALPDLWDDIASVSAENWYWFNTSSPRGEIGLSSPSGDVKGKYLYYGKGYVVKFRNIPSTFSWNVPSIWGTSGSTQNRKTTYFEYDETTEYMALDVLDIPAGVEEIGVFQNDTCIGGAVVDSSSATILCYEQPVERTQSSLTIETWGSRSASSVDYEHYNRNTQSFASKKLMAGSQDYALVRIIQTGESAPGIVELMGNYPNPFNPTTTIRYNLPQDGKVTITVYNVRGQRVVTLLSTKQTAGEHELTWNAQDQASGVYLLRLEAAGQTRTSKLLLLK